MACMLLHSAQPPSLTMSAPSLPLHLPLHLLSALRMWAPAMSHLPELQLLCQHGATADAASYAGTMRAAFSSALPIATGMRRELLSALRASKGLPAPAALLSARSLQRYAWPQHLQLFSAAYGISPPQHGSGGGASSGHLLAILKAMPKYSAAHASGQLATLLAPSRGAPAGATGPPLGTCAPCLGLGYEAGGSAAHTRAPPAASGSSSSSGNSSSGNSSSGNSSSGRMGAGVASKAHAMSLLGQALGSQVTDFPVQLCGPWPGMCVPAAASCHT